MVPLLAYYFPARVALAAQKRWWANPLIKNFQANTFASYEQHEKISYQGQYHAYLHTILLAIDIELGADGVCALLHVLQPLSAGKFFRVSGTVV